MSQDGEKQGRLLSGLLCGLSILPLNPPRPVSSALVVGLTVVISSTLLFDRVGRDVLVVKLGLWIKGLLMMVVGKDKKWKKKGRPDPAVVGGAKDKKRKRLVFIRHGESEWNLVFNVGPKILVPVKALVALIREILLFLQVNPGSILYDSPLNESGLRQARDLDVIFKDYDPDSPGAADVAACLGGRAVVATSNLRRAAQTVALGLKTRLTKNSSEKILVLSSLQEISTNIDTLSLTPAFTAPSLPNVSPDLAREDRFDVSFNSGNKLLRGNGLQRMQAFAEWAFKRDEDVIIVGGHSLWFKYFFREFLPSSANPYDARDVKIANGGVVALTIERGTVDDASLLGQVHYCVDPDSIVQVHLGFEKKKNKSKLPASSKPAAKLD